MTLADSAQKEILKKKYRKQRARADDARDDGDAETAARYYRQCADVLDQLAELASDADTVEKRESLAGKLRDLADKLDAEGIDSSAGTTDSTDGTDDTLDAAERFFVEAPDLDFDDVGGMDSLKQTFKEAIIDPLDRPALYDQYDLSTVNGVLLYGPPGTGKTYVTRALAGRLEFSYIELEAADLTSSLVGEAADNVAEVFEVAKDNQPCLVFLDEIDAIAAERSGTTQKTLSESQMITQFLTEMSGLGDSDVVFVAATNLPSEIDGAAWRRFDKRIEVPPPDSEGREAVLQFHLRGRPFDESRVDWSALGAATADYTPSDLNLVCEEAARKALQEATSVDEPQPITQRHVEAALDEIDPSLDAWDGYDLGTTPR